MLVLLIIWVLATLLLVLYYIVFVLPFTAIKAIPTQQSVLNLPPISVIICAKNELKNLKRNLILIAAQQYDADFEILVVNDASSDGTKEWLDSFCKKHHKVKTLHLKEGEKKGVGKKAALALGIKAASHQHLVLTDADCYPTGEFWLVNMAQGLVQHELVLGYSPLRPSENTESISGLLDIFCQFEAFNTAVTYFSFAHANLPYMGVGRNMAYTKTLFKEAKGFKKHEHLASGDDDLFVASIASKAKVTLKLNAESYMFSESPINWSRWIKQRLRHLSTSYRYTFKIKLMLAALGAANFSFYALLPITLASTYTWVVFLIVLKLLLQHYAFYKAAKQLNEKHLWMVSMPMEFVGVCLTILFHAYTLIAPKKEVKWT